MALSANAARVSSLCDICMIARSYAVAIVDAPPKSMRCFFDISDVTRFSSDSAYSHASLTLTA